MKIILLLLIIFITIDFGHAQFPDSLTNTGSIPDICIPQNAKVITNLTIYFDTLLTIDLTVMNKEYAVHYGNCCIDRFDIDEKYNIYILSREQIIKYSIKGECLWVKRFSAKNNLYDLDYINNNLYVLVDNSLLMLSANNGTELKTTDFSDSNEKYPFCYGGLYFYNSNFFIKRFDSAFRNLSEESLLKILNLQNGKWLEFRSLRKFVKYFFYNCKTYDFNFFMNLINHESWLFFHSQNNVNLLYSYFDRNNSITDDTKREYVYNYNKANNTVSKLNLDFELVKSINLHCVVPCEDGSFFIYTESRDEANIPSKIQFLNMKIIENTEE